MKKIVIYFVVLVFAGCSHKGQHMHEGDEELESLAYTLYSGKTEIFVEFKPLVVGRTSNFAAHFTILGEYFEPLSEGTVTVKLVVDGKEISQTTNEPSVPGIYRLALTPDASGTGDLIFDIKTEEFTDRQIIKGVTIFPDQEAALTGQVSDGAGGGITYLKEQAWKVEFANMEVKKQNFYEVIRTSGQILPAPGDEMMVTAKSDGIVLFSGNAIVIGTSITQGNPLFVISSGDLVKGSPDAIYQESRANYDNAILAYERAKELIKDQLISQKELADAELNFLNAQIEFKAVSKNYAAGSQNVLAPMNGYLKDIFVKEGQFVEAGQPLASISQNKKLILQAIVSQKYYSKIPSVRSANFKMPGEDFIYSTEELNGKLLAYGKSTSSGAVFVPVSFEINNSSGIVPGSAVEVFLRSSAIPDVLVIPTSSLIEEQGNYFVYVQKGGESFEKREIKIGAGDGKDVMVISGLNEGERVVSRGAYQIKLSSASGAMPAHGHEH